MWSAIVGGFTFLWLAHHSLVYRSKNVDDDWEDVDGIKVGVFPKHNDDLKLELAWTIVPFLILVFMANSRDIFILTQITRYFNLQLTLFYRYFLHNDIKK